MTGVSFHFELVEEQPRVHGLAMGHVTVQVGSEVASTKERDQSVMIFLTLTSFFDGVRKVVVRGGTALVVGVDGSFELQLSCKKNCVSFRAGKRLLGEVSVQSVVQALWQEGDRVAKQYRDRFDRDDSTSDGAFDDLTKAMSDFATQVLPRVANL